MFPPGLFCPLVHLFNLQSSNHALSGLEGLRYAANASIKILSSLSPPSLSLLGGLLGSPLSLLGPLRCPVSFLCLLMLLFPLRVELNCKASGSGTGKRGRTGGVEKSLPQWDPLLTQAFLLQAWALTSSSGIGINLAYSSREPLQTWLPGKVVRNEHCTREPG